MIHNQLVGGEHYEQTDAGIQNALEAGLSVSINTPLCRDNADYVTTLRYLHSIGVTYVTCSGLIITGNATLDDSIRRQLTKEEITEVIREAVIYCHKSGMEISFTSPGWIPEWELRNMGISIPSCGACLSNMAITPDGEVVECQSALSNESYGNILDTEFEKIWNHPRCKERRDRSAKMLQLCPLWQMEEEGKQK